MKKFLKFILSSMFVFLMFLSVSLSAQTPTITLLQPSSAGIEWTVGGTYLISWVDNFQSTTDILLSSDGGATYPTTLATGLSGSTWSWSTTGLSVGSNYKIKVQSTNSPGSYFDYSDNTFALVDETGGSISLNQPVGNEEIPSGSTYLISWNDNLTAPVKVELLENNVLKTTLSSGTTGTTLNWAVPTTGITTDSKIYKIKVSSTVAGSSTQPAISNRFTITSSSGTYVTVLQPNGGERWAVGTSHLISWNDDLGENVKIELKKGGTYSTIANDVSGSTYIWNIPAGQATGTNCKIKISSTVDGSIKDFSDARFTIAGSSGTYVEVLQPNGGESWAVGTSHLISWDDDFAEAVDIQLKIGGVYTPIASGVTGSTYLWNIPSNQATSNNCRIKITNSVDGSIHDRSDSRFALTASAGTFVEVLQPNGGESWTRGTSHLISWNDDLSEPVNIKLYKWGTFITDVATNVTGSTYTWDIPSGLNTGNGYKVKVFSTLDGSLKDYSDAAFHITASGGTFVEVLQPNGGESWAVGTTHLISWNDDFAEPVNIELKIGGTYTSIATGVTGSTYYWDIPLNQTTATNCKIKIYSTLDNHIKDFSDSNFEIAASSGTFVEVLNPNGGENWARGNSYLISWNDDIVEDVKIILVKGGVESTIANNIAGSSYMWSIPSNQQLGSNYKIKVESVLDASIYDRSDANFSIDASAGTYVTVQQPNGGENWTRGNSYLISWIDDFTEPVDIKLVKGGVVTDIASNVEGSTYTWDIPANQQTGTNFKVKIISTLDGSLYDYSDSRFEISASSGTYVTVVNPNGGETWVRGTSHLITWIDDFPEAVDIKLVKGGVVTDIADDVEGSTYSWDIPAAQQAGSNYKVKIISTLDGSIHDISNSNFTISVTSMMSVYPNPATNNITLNVEDLESGDYTVVLFNRFNKAVYQSNINTNVSSKIVIPVTGLTNGLYFVNVKKGDFSQSEKVIIQH